MIVKMDKVTILVSAREQEQSLVQLRKLGVVHIKHLQLLQSSDLATLQRKLATIDRALSALSIECEQKKIQNNPDPMAFVSQALSLQKERKALQKKQERLLSIQEWFERWGRVSLATLAALQQKGIFVTLYTCQKRDLKNVSVDKNVFVLCEDKNTSFIALVSRSKEERLSFQKHEFPDMELASVQKEAIEVAQRILAIDNDLVGLAGYQDQLQIYKSTVAKELEFYKVKHGMLQEERFCYLEGFCPREAVTLLTAESQKQGWGLISQEPQDIQEVPTFIRYPKWVKIIEPVFKFIGTLPGYAEYDISPWFLIFFSIFFAMLIGDAGYGVLFLLITLFFQKKFSQAPKQPFFLMYVLSGVTILWGAVTGTWFGAEQIAKLPIFNSLVIGQVNSFIDTNQFFLMQLCFLIGAIQLTIAHGIIAFRYINSLYALAQLGWIAIVWGIFFLAGNLVLYKPFPEFAQYLLIAGVGLVVLFSNFQKNILKGIAISIANLPLKLIGAFGDTLSYLRLFAVGFASVMVAVSFNTMALEVGFSSVISGIFAAVILFLGHALNIILGLMSVLVHGIRLNMLEFSGHLDMEWSGREYQPFKE